MVIALAESDTSGGFGSTHSDLESIYPKAHSEQAMVVVELLHFWHLSTVHFKTFSVIGFRFDVDFSTMVDLILNE